MQLVGFSESSASVLALRVRTHLCEIAGHAIPITYQALARALDLAPPHTIHQLTVALECLMEEDAAAACPLIAALVVSKAQGGLPALGFFECAQHIGRFNGDPSGPEATEFYAAEFDAAAVFWSAVAKDVVTDL